MNAQIWLRVVLGAGAHAADSALAACDLWPRETCAR